MSSEPAPLGIEAWMNECLAVLRRIADGVAGRRAEAGFGPSAVDPSERQLLTSEETASSRRITSVSAAHLGGTSAIGSLSSCQSMKSVRGNPFTKVAQTLSSTLTRGVDGGVWPTGGPGSASPVPWLERWRRWGETRFHRASIAREGAMGRSRTRNDANQKYRAFRGYALVSVDPGLGVMTRRSGVQIPPPLRP